MVTYHKALKIRDLPPGQSVAVQVGERRIALFNVGGTIHAVEDSCSHRGGPLSEGHVDGHVVTCPLHGASFDIRTGTNLSPPAPQPVPTYPVRIEGEDIEVEVP